MRQKEKKTKIKNKKRFYTILTIVLVLVTSGIAYGAYTYNKLKNPEDLFAPVVNEEVEEDIDINAQFDKSKINIMLVGFDKDEVRSKSSDLFRSDTNIVLTIDLVKKTVDMISIPRDSYVPIAHRGGKDKFNSAYGYGYQYGPSDDKDKDGFQYLMDTASELLGDVPIYYYTAVDMDVVTEIVDAIGGVEIEVPIDLYKKHGKDRSEIIINEGYQELDGFGLLYYARYRHYPKGDIERVENQQKILLATFDSLKKSNMFSSLPKIYQSAQKNINTNLSINQIAALALLAKDMDRESIDTHMIPGDFGNLNELSYWIVDQEERAKLIHDVYGITITAEKQDPTQERLVSLDATISQNILEVGEKAQIASKGVTNLGYKKMFDPGDVIYSTSNNNIVSVSDNGRVTATGGGNATITIKTQGMTKQINITVKLPKDTTSPTITLKGSQNINIKAGGTFADPGATAQDNIDGNLTNAIKKSGGVDTGKVGTYKITYSVSDKAGNTTNKVRTVIVEKAETPPPSKPVPETPTPEELEQPPVEEEPKVPETPKQTGDTSPETL